MKFYVIYSFDVKRSLSVVPYKPPFIKQWSLTEGDEQYEYDYLADESDNDNDYRNGKHRKYTAELNKEQFKRFIEDQDMHMEDIETMGSITEYGHLPAFSFNGEIESHHYDPIWQNAYVTPFPQRTKKDKSIPFIVNGWSDKNWNRLKRAMLNMFGY